MYPLVSTSEIFDSQIEKITNKLDKNIYSKTSSNNTITHTFFDGYDSLNFASYGNETEKAIIYERWNNSPLKTEFENIVSEDILYNNTSMDVFYTNGTVAHFSPERWDKDIKTPKYRFENIT